MQLYRNNSQICCKPDTQEQIKTYQYQPLTVIGLEEMILPQNSTFLVNFCCYISGYMLRWFRTHYKSTEHSLVVFDHCFLSL